MAVRARAWSVVVPHDARGARLARQQLAVELHGLIADLGGYIDAGTIVDAVAVVGELLGNAVRHADALPGGVIRLECRVKIDPAPAGTGARIQVRVTDGGATQPPAPRQAAPDAVDGRGLAIVDALALRWGVEREGGGQCVWAELGGVGGPRA